MASESQNLTGDLIRLVHSLGHRNRAGAPLVPAKAPYDVDLALRLVTAAQEVIQRVASDPSRTPANLSDGATGAAGSGSRSGALAVVSGGRARRGLNQPAARAPTPRPTSKPQP